VTCEVEVNAWSGVRVGDVSVATSVVKSMVENVSSPTLLMRHVMRLVIDVVVRHVVVRDGVVAAVLAVPPTPDMPLIPVTSRTVMARTESFLKSIKFFSHDQPLG
jgi:hypothetical protein